MCAVESLRLAEQLEAVGVLEERVRQQQSDEQRLPVAVSQQQDAIAALAVAMRVLSRALREAQEETDRHIAHVNGVTKQKTTEDGQ